MNVDPRYDLNVRIGLSSSREVLFTVVSACLELNGLLSLIRFLIMLALLLEIVVARDQIIELL